MIIHARAERYPSADADRAGQQRCHRAHGELYTLQQNVPNAQLILYPDANHGSFYQYPELFVLQADQFLTSALQGDDTNPQSSERLPFPSVVSTKGI